MGAILRFAAIIVGVLLIVAGIPLLLSPIPVGLVMIGLGVVLLAASSRRAQRFIRSERQRHPHFDDELNTVEAHMPGPARGPLEKTRPERR
jgi:hypothetical protein